MNRHSFEDSSSDDELITERILKPKEEDAVTPMSITAKILAQRDEAVQQAKEREKELERIDKEEEEEDEESTDSGDDNSEEGDNSDGDSSEEGSEGEGSEEGSEEESDKTEETKEDKDKSEEEKPVFDNPAEESTIDKERYSEESLDGKYISMEGVWGGLAGLISGALPVLGLVANPVMERQIRIKTKRIKAIKKDIDKIRREGLKEALKNGDIDSDKYDKLTEEIGTMEDITALVRGVIPLYRVIVLYKSGSKLENLTKEFDKHVKELDRLLDQADYDKKLAETELSTESSDGLELSTEGVWGGITGILGGLIPIYSYFHNPVLANRARRKVKQIKSIERDIARIRRDGIEKAFKDGRFDSNKYSKIKEEIGSIKDIKAMAEGFIPFYGLYKLYTNGSKLEDLTNKFERLVQELDDLIDEGEVDKQQVKEDLSTEAVSMVFSDLFSMEQITPKSWGIFNKMREHAVMRDKELMEFGISMEDSSYATSNAPIAHTKDEIIEAIVGLGNINHKYATSTKDFIEKIEKSLLRMNDRLTAFETVFEAGEIEYTNKVMTDIEVLRYVLNSKDATLRDTLRIIHRFNKDGNSVCRLLPESEFDTITGIFNSNGYVAKTAVKESHDSRSDKQTNVLLQYKNILPGFTRALAHIPIYQDYLKTDILEFQYYSTRENNPSDLYDLTPVSVTEDNDVKYYVENLKETIVELGVSIDILKSIMNNFESFVNSLKLLRTEIEDDRHENLSDLGLDDKVKEFIKFKIIVEVISVSVNITIDYMSNFMTILDNSLVFKEPTV